MCKFNSLGSNYELAFAWQALFAINKESYRFRLIEFLKKKYTGEVLLTYKGREALRLALRMIFSSVSSRQVQTIKPSVGICGFTCYAVYEAIVKEGYKTRYLDIADSDLNFSFDKLVKSIHKYPSMKVLIVQNTLGFPCEMEKIGKFCKERGIVLIEDLAHSIGAKYPDGKESGTVGDFSILSFSQDKMVDGISGGALIVRNEKFQISNFKFQISNLEWGIQLRDRFYPLFTYLIRKTYGSGIGKGLHVFLRKFDLLSKPMNGLREDKIYALSNWYCYLIYRQFVCLEKDLFHRRRIASIYANGLDKKILSSVLNALISKASNLRFPIFIPNNSVIASDEGAWQSSGGLLRRSTSRNDKNERDKLIDYLKKQDIFVSDIWFDSPIAPKSYLQLTDYNYDCTNSEKTSSMILNLPTHRNIGEEDAKYIVDMVNEWVEGNIK